MLIMLQSGYRITKKQQLSAGVKYARASCSHFWPFSVASEMITVAVGLPEEDELYDIAMAYCAPRFV
ncbi:hypothetical protein HZS36_21520 [Kalamiella piersonii]|jgi:hypothetical protein|nr:hypothetical protein [Pantoea piersonii]NYB09245.1 hypothetical protein [Pantoea piersonii]NYB36637.1 hypothetical protein [Pantoea piersonii]